MLFHRIVLAMAIDFNHSTYSMRTPAGSLPPLYSPPMLRLALAAGLLALMAAGPADAQSRKGRSLEVGEMLAQSCMTCHGTRGTSSEQEVPTIGGQSEQYLTATMKAYRDGRRPSTIMDRIAKAYSTKEIDALAVYFAAQPFGRPQQAVDPEKVARGQIVHGRKCNRCHLHGGRDANEAESPLLAGQKLDYLRRNMDEIMAGKRSIEIKMDAALREITREEIEATLHFYAAQHGELN